MTHSFTRKLFLRLIAGSLIPCYGLAVCLRAYANNPTATAVYQRDTYSGSGLDRLLRGVRGGNSTSTNPVRRDDQFTDLSQYLWVPGNNRSWATLVYKYSNDPGSKLGVATGTSSTASTYYFSCQFEAGKFVIGWNAGDSGQRPCASQGARINVDTQKRAALSQSIAQKTNPKTNAAAAPASAAEPLLDQQAYIGTNPLLQYCTVAARNRGWWLRWDTQRNPCQEVEQLCAATGSDEDCKILSQGEWRAKDENLFLAIVCAEDQIYTARGSGLEMAETLLPQLAQQADAEHSKACAVNIYRPMEVIATPVTNDETLIQASGDSGALVVDVLAGSVLIRSAQQPTGKLLRAGDRYNYPQDTTEAIDVSDVTRQSPLVQIFLNPDNWPPNSTDVVKNYRASLGDSGRVASDEPRKRRNGFLNFLLPILGVIGGAILGNELGNDGSRGDNGRETIPEQPSTDSSDTNTAPTDIPPVDNSIPTVPDNSNNDQLPPVR